jgi:iron-sulfur-dependent L-serine dehydratase beta subunit
MPIRHDRKVSILDVMGPVMVGPSSSHTAGTARLGRVAREILDEEPLEVHFFLHPPLAATYRGHGSDFALVGGAIGLNVDDPRIPEAIRIAEQMEVKVEFGEEDLGEVHPNTVRIETKGRDARSRDHRLVDRRGSDRGLQDQRLSSRVSKATRRRCCSSIAIAAA